MDQQSVGQRHAFVSGVREDAAVCGFSRQPHTRPPQAPHVTLEALTPGRRRWLALRRRCTRGGGISPVRSSGVSDGAAHPAFGPPLSGELLGGLARVDVATTLPLTGGMAHSVWLLTLGDGRRAS
jgi:hypothetical protein